MKPIGSEQAFQISVMELGKKKKKMAVLVGINYFNTSYELHGCINDVTDMKDSLINRFGFDPTNIAVLTDEQDSSVMPTGANIRKALTKMMDEAEEGDIMFFHYSGHGTRIPSKTKGHAFREDEAIVPCDSNLITSLDFRQMVNHLKKGSSFTFLSDSCHSGGLIDKEKEQIGPSSDKDRNQTYQNPRCSIPRTIPFDSLLQHLSSLTNITTSDIGTHLLELFGEDASIKFQLPDFQHDSLSSPWKPDDGILLSACQGNESAADMSPNMSGGKAYGAFSSAVQTAWKEDENPCQWSNKQIVMKAREILQARMYSQHPCLYCSDENAEATFLGKKM